MLFRSIVRESVVFYVISRYVSSIFLIFAFKERLMQNFKNETAERLKWRKFSFLQTFLTNVFFREVCEKQQSGERRLLGTYRT